MGKKKRIEWVDIVKYVCIIMVMLSHLETRTEVWRAFYQDMKVLVLFLLRLWRLVFLLLHFIIMDQMK